MLSRLKAMFERAFACRIYRTSLPRGVDLAYDIERDFGRNAVSTILDVGANVGQSARHYVMAFPGARICCFEPVASTFAQLAKNVSRLPQVRTFEVGLGAEDGYSNINVGADSRLSSVTTNRPGDTSQRIQITTLDRFCAANQIAEIDLLKIDTEGYELAVLRGGAGALKAGRVKFVQIEAAPSDATGYFVGFGSVMAYLSGFGYELYGIYDQTSHWTGRKALLFFNLVFISPQMLEEPSFVDVMKSSCPDSPV